MVVGLICPSALVAAIRPTKARWLAEGFTPEMNTGVLFVLLTYLDVYRCVDVWMCVRR